MLAINELKDLLTEADCDFEIISHPKAIVSAADAEGLFDFEKAAPVYILKTEQGLISLIVKAQSERIDLQRIKEDLGFTKFKFADKKEILLKTGYNIGAIALVGHNLPCFMDERLLNMDYIYGGTGDYYHTLKINPKDVMRLNNHTRIIKIA